MSDVLRATGDRLAKVFLAPKTRARGDGAGAEHADRVTQAAAQR